MSDISLIESERLLLRRLAEKDVDDLLLLFGDPIAMRWFPSVKDRDQTAQWLKLNLDTFETTIVLPGVPPSVSDKKERSLWDRLAVCACGTRG